MSQQERSQVWYNAEEFNAIRSSVHDDLTRAHHFHKLGGSKQVHKMMSENCFRGLEHHFAGCSNRKRQKRQYYVRYLLHTQYKCNAVNDHYADEHLRELAESLSSPDARRAQHFAAFDAMEAYKVHQESFANDEEVPDAIIAQYPEFHDVPKASFLCTGRKLSSRGRSQSVSVAAVSAWSMTTTVLLGMAWTACMNI